MRQGANLSVLAQVRRDVEAEYGNRLDRLLLYGSRARGDASDESDYDIAVFIDPLEDRLRELYRLADMTVSWFDKTSALVHAMPFDARRFGDGSPLMKEIGRDGVAL